MTPFASALVGGAVGSVAGLFVAGLGAFKRADVGMVMWASALAGSAIGASVAKDPNPGMAGAGVGTGGLPPKPTPTLPSRKA